MAKRIYLVGGSKGGVGKSLVTMATVDYLQDQGESILVIESDTSNPDVWKTYHDCTLTELVNLDEANGWIELVNLCESHPDSIVVINTAARNNQGGECLRENPQWHPGGTETGAGDAMGD